MQVSGRAANSEAGPGARSQSETSLSPGGQSEAELQGGISDDLYPAALSSGAGLAWPGLDVLRQPQCQPGQLCHHLDDLLLLGCLCGLNRCEMGGVDTKNNHGSSSTRKD